MRYTDVMNILTNADIREINEYPNPDEHQAEEVTQWWECHCNDDIGETQEHVELAKSHVKLVKKVMITNPENFI